MARFGCSHPRVIEVGNVDACPRCGRVRSVGALSWREPNKREHGQAVTAIEAAARVGRDEGRAT